MSTTSYTPSSWLGQAAGPIPKLSSTIESQLLQKISGPSIANVCDGLAEPVYVHRIVRYFVKALDFVPLFIDATGRKGKSEDYKDFKFAQSECLPIVSLLSSTLFYWFWRGHSDGFHCGYGDVYLMPYLKPTQPATRTSLEALAKQLMAGLLASSMEKTISTKAGRIRYQEFYPKESKPIIDEIDRVLAKHYGFSDEELDFIINYDIKYRMGRDGAEAE